MLQAAGEWVAAYPDEEKDQILMEEPELKAKWDDEYGDRMTELVIIGVDMDLKEIETQLNSCLLTDEEMNMDWTKLSDPLPAFTV